MKALFAFALGLTGVLYLNARAKVAKAQADARSDARDREDKALHPASTAAMADGADPLTPVSPPLSLG